MMEKVEIGLVVERMMRWEKNSKKDERSEGRDFYSHLTDG